MDVSWRLRLWVSHIGVELAFGPNRNKWLLLDLSQVTPNALGRSPRVHELFIALLPPARGKPAVALLCNWDDGRNPKQPDARILEPHMCEVIRFVPKSELERARLVREARAIYDSIFPQNDAVSERGGDKTSLHRG